MSQGPPSTILFHRASPKWAQPINFTSTCNQCMLLLFQLMRVVYRSWFQVSRSPGTHQCVQSMFPSPLYVLGCASFLNWERFVTLSKWMGFVILPKTSSSTWLAGGKPAGYVDPLIGCVSFEQFVTPGLPHSLPLFLHTCKRNMRVGLVSS